MPYRVVTAKNNMPSLIFQEEREIRLHSLFDPLKESKRAVDSFKTGRSSIILVSGLALGYHVSELAVHYPQHHIIVLELSKEVAHHAKKVHPQIEEQCSIIHQMDELPQFFENFDITTFRGIAHFIHKPSVTIDPDFYHELETSIKQYLNSKLSDTMTRFEFEQTWLNNIFTNSSHLTSAIPVSAFFQSFTSIPGIIVSAGPSLRKNISQLKDAKEKALIVAVDTALKPLLTAGIEPHFVITLDAQKHSLKHFSGANTCSTLLIADMVSYPPILRDFYGRRVLSSTAKYYTGSNGETNREVTPGMKWFEEQGVNTGDLQSGGSVATTAFDFLLNTGCNPIIFMGQDLAYTGREIHCSGTHHNDSWLPITSRIKNLDTINQGVVRKRKIKYIPAWGGGTVIADFVFDLYRQWFEEGIAKITPRVINASEGGGSIAGVEEVPLQRLLSEMPPLTPTPEEIIIDLLQKEPPTAPHLKDGLKALIKQMEPVCSDHISEDRINSILQGATGDLLLPFIRKSEVMINRGSKNEEESFALIANDIKEGALAIIGMAQRALENIPQ
jgi:hypothetical protein